MNYTTDHDGKSKTASAADQNHYPEQHEVDRVDFVHGNGHPPHDQIASRAYELWCERGCPDGSPDQDWLRAEVEIEASNASQAVMRSTAAKGGSVQG